MGERAVALPRFVVPLLAMDAVPQSPPLPCCAASPCCPSALLCTLLLHAAAPCRPQRRPVGRGEDFARFGIPLDMGMVQEPLLHREARRSAAEDCRMLETVLQTASARDVFDDLFGLVVDVVDP